MSPDAQTPLTAVESAAVAVAETAPPMPGDLGAAFAKMFLTLVSLLLLFGISFWFLRRLIQNRLQKGGDHSLIHVVEKRMISPKTMLYVIDVDGKKILVAESHLEIKRLDSLPEKLS
jgi:flagellar protein FliO/FliZ